MINMEIYSKKELLLKKMSRYIFTFIIVLVSVAIFFINYALNFQQKEIAKYLEQVAIHIASNVRGRITNQIYDLRLLSSKLTTDIDLNSQYQIKKFLEQNIKKERYFRLGFFNPDGKGIRYQENIGEIAVIDYQNEHCFQEALAGKPCFAQTIKASDSKDGFINHYFVPVYDKNSKIVGVLSSQMITSTFQRILNYSNFQGKSFSHIIDKNGNYILKAQNELNIYDNIFDPRIEYINTDIEAIKENLRNNKPGVFSFKWNDGKIYLGAYSPIEFNDMFVLTDIQKDVLMIYLDDILIGVGSIVVFIGILFLFLLRYTNRIHKKSEKAIYNIAFVDDVTGAGNNNKFLLDAKEHLLKSKDEDNFYMIAADISKFKIIDELYGYKYSETILKDVFDILKKNIPDNFAITRDSLSTYFILYKYNDGEDIVKDFIDKVIEDIKKYNMLTMQKITANDNDEYKVFSKLFLVFGIYPIIDKNGSIEQMKDRALLAKQNIEDNISSSYQFYDDTFRAELFKNKAIEDEMQESLENQEFHMFLQPKFDLNTSEIRGAEALVRWIHSKRGLIPPMDFIPLFEKNGFVMEIDKCIWEQACAFLSERKKFGRSLFPISVNVSRLHMNNDAFIKELVNLVRKYDIEPKYIQLELTESACLNDEERFIAVTKKLKDEGFAIAMDDFGTGYSSLNMLRHLPIDVLKLDRGFITDSIMEEKGKIVVKSILSMAEELEMETVAEGIETLEQAEFLRNAGCKIAQGFLYGRPMDIEMFTQSFLSEENKV